MKLATILAVSLCGTALATALALPHSPDADANESDADTALDAEAGNETTEPIIVPFELDLDLATVLHRTCLDPDSMAAVGMDAFGAQGVIAAAKTAQATLGTTLQQADAAWAEANVAAESLARTVRSGLATDAEVQALKDAKAARTLAEADRKAALDGIFALATEGLSADARATLQCVRANQGWHLDVPYLCAERSEEEWVMLRDALANEAICAADGTDPDAACQSMIATAASAPAVAAALVGIDTHGPSIQASWDAALAD